MPLTKGKRRNNIVAGLQPRLSPLPDGVSLNLEHAVGPGWLLRLQNRQRNVVYGASRGGFAVETATVRVAVQDEICAMAIDDLGEA